MGNDSTLVVSFPLRSRISGRRELATKIAGKTPIWQGPASLLRPFSESQRFHRGGRNTPGSRLPRPRCRSLDSAHPGAVHPTVRAREGVSVRQKKAGFLPSRAMKSRARMDSLRATVAGRVPMPILRPPAGKCLGLSQADASGSHRDGLLLQREAQESNVWVLPPTQYLHLVRIPGWVGESGPRGDIASPTAS